MWIFCLILMICCLGLLIKMGIQKKQINRIRPCLKNGKTPSLGTFFRQDCVDLT